MRSRLTFLLCLAFTASAFAQTTNNVVCSFSHNVGANSLVLNQTISPIWNNKNIQISRAEFYISEISILHPDSTVMPLTDQYILVNANAPDAEFDMGNWPVDAAHGITLHLGVPQAVNHNDPATYPATHPLAMQNPTMHWGWSSGYRFMAIEGKVDNNNDGIPETDFEFHNLGDALYRTVELSSVETAENGVLHLHFVVDYVQLFKSIAMTGNLIQHGSAAINIKMMNNADKESFITMPVASSVHEVVVNSQTVSAVPNPFKTTTTIEYTLTGAETATMLLTNSLGQTVRTVNALPANGTIYLEKGDLPGGIYQYTFYQKGKLQARKQLIITE